MLQWAAACEGSRFCLYIHRTDAEGAYDGESHIGKLDKGLDEWCAIQPIGLPAPRANFGRWLEFSIVINEGNVTCRSAVLPLFLLRHWRRGIAFPLPAEDVLGCFLLG